eukprot:8817166-Pyramimonas_sp.AAC.1
MAKQFPRPQKYTRVHRLPDKHGGRVQFYQQANSMTGHASNSQEAPGIGQGNSTHAAEQDTVQHAHEKGPLDAKKNDHASYIPMLCSLRDTMDGFHD